MVSRNGIGDVTIGSLAEEIGMSKSGLFAHFGSKENLQLALLEESSRLFQAGVIAPIMAREPGLQRVVALFEFWFGWTTTVGLKGGCPVAAAMFEFDDNPSPIREEIVRIDELWRGMMTSLVQETVDRGQFRANLDCQQFVWELCGIYLCFHVSSRFAKDSEARQRAQTAFYALVERAV